MAACGLPVWCSRLSVAFCDLEKKTADSCDNSDNRVIFFNVVRCFSGNKTFVKIAVSSNSKAFKLVNFTDEAASHSFIDCTRYIYSNNHLYE